MFEWLVVTVTFSRWEIIAWNLLFTLIGVLFVLPWLKVGR